MMECGIVIIRYRERKVRNRKMINNPYEVLGVSPSASDDEIKSIS